MHRHPRSPRLRVSDARRATQISTAALLTEFGLPVDARRCDIIRKRQPAERHVIWFVVRGIAYSFRKHGLSPIQSSRASARACRVGDIPWVDSPKMYWTSASS